MKRRVFILGLCASACDWLSRGRAQTGPRVIGIWWDAVQLSEQLTRYKERLVNLGWVEGRNVRFEIRTWNGDTSTMRQQADELITTHPDVIVALSNPAVAILKPVSGKLPIVFGMVADPVGSGFIDNLAKPGGAITGFTNFEPSMGSKWLEVRREAAPLTTRILILLHPETTAHKRFLEATQESARSLDIDAIAAGVHSAAEVEQAFAKFSAAGSGGGFIALPHPITEVNRDLIIQEATKRLMPSIFAFETHAYAGALATYGIDRAETILQTADYVDRILRGTKPADLTETPSTAILISSLAAYPIATRSDIEWRKQSAELFLPWSFF